MQFLIHPKTWFALLAAKAHHSLTHVEPTVSQQPQVPFCRGALQSLINQSVVMPSIIPTQVQNLAFKLLMQILASSNWDDNECVTGPQLSVLISSIIYINELSGIVCLHFHIEKCHNWRT